MSLPNSAPKRVGRYRLLAPIARGGAATVYLGRSEGIGGFQRIVAVKLLHPHLLEDASSQASKEFIEEAKLSATMQHPMIVPVMDVGESEEGFFLVMDYVDGASLSEIIREEEKIPHSVILRIMSDALEGLAAAHNAKDEKGRKLGIVHRDFSPQNILVGVDGRSRLTDFGIARATTRAEYTRTGLVKGKVAYMSPEQAEGKPLDLKSDVWAAGVVAWELFAGRRMYPQLDPMPMMLKIINDPPPWIRKANPDLPESLEEALETALDPNQKRRCGSALEFRDALVEAMGGPSSVASREEVGAFVTSLNIERLQELRAIVQEETKSRALPAGAPLAEATTHLEGSPGIQIESGTFATTSAEMSTPGGTAELEGMFRKRGGTWAALAAVAVVGVGAWLLGPFGDGEALQDQGTVASATEKSADDRTEGIATKADQKNEAKEAGEETAPTPEARVRSEITVTGSEPFQSVIIGRRTIALPSPTETATVRLIEAEQGAVLEVVAVTKDGRRARAELAEEERSIELSFPEATRRPYRAPRPAKPQKKKPSDLAASPY